MSGALPPLAPGAIPASVRHQGADAVQGFRTALGFERLLLTQMLSAALPSSEASGESSEGGEGEGEAGFGADPREADLPGTVADAIVSQGGAGLAGQLYASFEPGR